MSSLDGAGRAARAALGLTGLRPSSRTLPPRLAVLADERLAWLVARGSKRALSTLYERYESQLYAYCYLLLHDNDDAYDALQATFTRALVALRRGQRDGLVRQWLFHLAREEAVSLERDREVASGVRQTLVTFPRIEDGSDERARLALLMADLRQLPERQRSALLLRELTGLSHSEIATSLGISTQGAKQAIFHARRSLAEFQGGRSLACDEVRRMISHRDGRIFRRRSVRAHLHDCRDCTAFAAAIDTRRNDLRALVPPVAPSLLSGLIAQFSETASGHGAGVTAGWASRTCGTSLTGKICLAAAIAR